MHSNEFLILILIHRNSCIKYI
eukprot:COSAG02_NODE_17190_length_1022_cov_1.781148_2_plen_21_part_01